MPHGQLYINGLDAYDEWGMSMDGTALSSLMTPAGMKGNIKASSRLSHGARVVNLQQDGSLYPPPRLDSRQLTLTVQFTARTEEDFFDRYASFCQTVLYGGFLDIETSFQPGTVYHMEYNSCQQFTQFMRGYAKFVLKLTENDPSDRTSHTSTT